MENRLLDKVSRVFSVELPPHDTMEEYLEAILPVVRPWSEDLTESHFFLEKGWLEVRDDDDFHEDVLHFFNQDNEYLQSIDGNVHKGVWRLMPAGSNKILIEQKAGTAVVKSELFDLAYLDDYFFILKKHGDQVRKGQAKYFVMGYEPVIAGYEWREVMEELFNKYRSNNRLYRNLALFILFLIIAAILFSWF